MTTIAGSVAVGSLGTGAVAGSSHPDPKARGREAHLLLVIYIGSGIGSLKQRPPPESLILEGPPKSPHYLTTAVFALENNPLFWLRDSVKFSHKVDATLARLAAITDA